MSRNWSLFLVVAFVLGFGTKTYLDSLDKPADVSETTSSEQSVLFGENNQPVNVFDVNDPRIRIVYSVLLVALMSAQHRSRCWQVH